MPFLLKLTVNNAKWLNKTSNIKKINIISNCIFLKFLNYKLNIYLISWTKKSPIYEW